jgi:hypothetical protein
MLKDPVVPAAIVDQRIPDEDEPSPPAEVIEQRISE